MPDKQAPAGGTRNMVGVEDLIAEVKKFDTYGDDWSQDDVVNLLCTLPLASISIKDKLHMHLEMAVPLNGQQGYDLGAAFPETEYTDPDNTSFDVVFDHGLLTGDELAEALAPYEAYAGDNMEREEMQKSLSCLPIHKILVLNNNNMTLWMARPLNGLESFELTMLCIEIEYRAVDQIQFDLHW
jgi:hypothetical protein